MPLVSNIYKIDLTQKRSCTTMGWLNSNHIGGSFRNTEPFMGGGADPFKKMAH